MVNEKNKVVNKIEIQDLDLFYGDFQALKDVDMDIQANNITAV